MPDKSSNPISFSRKKDEEIRDSARRLHDLIVELKQSSYKPCGSGLASNPVYKDSFVDNSGGSVKHAVIEYNKSMWEESSSIICQLLESNNVSILEQVDFIYRDSGIEVVRILVDISKIR